MKVLELFDLGKDFVKKNSTSILQKLTIVGTVISVVTTAACAIKAYKAIERYKEDVKDCKDEKVKEELKVGIVKEVAFTVAPAVIATTATIISETKMIKDANAKVKFLSAAYAVSQTNLEKTNLKLSSLKDTIKEQFGEDKARDIRDRDRAKRASNIPINESIFVGNGKVPCVDLYHDSRLIFYSSVPEIESAINELSSECRDENYVTVYDLYQLLKIENIPLSLNDIGWTTDALSHGKLPIEITTFKHPSGVPCIAIDYETDPRFGDRFRRSY